MASSRDLQSEVAMFAHLVCRPEAELDLALAALTIAEPEYPGLDIAHYLQVLDELGQRARVRTFAVRDPAVQAITLVNQLLREEHFQGNVAHYADPKNSFLNEVLDRRLGIPITLALVMTEVARRAEVPLAGVSFPGHFLVRGGPVEGPPTYVDPFTGRALAPRDLRELLRRMTGEVRDPTPGELQAVSKRAILTRMLNNLRNIYMASGDTRRLNLCLERIKVLEQAPGGRRTPSGIVH